ncbi:MAG: hypothetical protein KJ887_06820 [Candidatus Omnitrophica bacterium]|nr:hypothetical protein [Candidatus Omnitrophota bacterium]MBU1048236.1 hypothetical protein [Candidatus Omnitrophota bacterium]MBU1630980.1 hypothetical protein [Candidatus Omnitrophota bacterium]MBU1889752.1 hypothetical protein [Candidatus Omnitrophota bacterium]
MSTCTKCLKKEATLRCKMCHRPICEDCGISAPSGIFCSEECGKKMESHVERIKEIDEERPIIKQKRIPTIVKLIIWFVVLWIVARFILKIDIIESIKELLGLLKLKI